MDRNKVLTPVPELVGLAVPVDELRCPEFCFRIVVNFGIKLKDDSGVNHLKQILTALLNTSGGVMVITTSDGICPQRDALDNWKRNLEESFASFIPLDTCQLCIHVLDHTFPIQILVKKSHKLITLKSNMDIRWLAGNKIIQDSDRLNIIITQPTGEIPCKNPFEGKTAVMYLACVTVNEGPNIEFKCWTKVTSFDDGTDKNTYMSRLRGERTQRTLFALPNMPEGGFMIIGVDDSGKVIGQVINDEDKNALVVFIGEFLLKDQGKTRVWNGPETPRKGIDWTIEFIPVDKAPDDRSLIIIGFKHYPGGVFQHRPESYIISEEGYVVHMPIEEWIETLARPISQVGSERTYLNVQEGIQRMWHQGQSCKKKEDTDETNSPPAKKLRSNFNSESSEHSIGIRPSDTQDESTENKGNTENEVIASGTGLDSTAMIGPNRKASDEAVAIPVKDISIIANGRDDHKHTNTADVDAAAIKGDPGTLGSSNAGSDACTPNKNIVAAPPNEDVSSRVQSKPSGGITQRSKTMDDISEIASTKPPVGTTLLQEKVDGEHKKSDHTVHSTYTGDDSSDDSYPDHGIVDPNDEYDYMHDNDMDDSSDESYYDDDDDDDYGDFNYHDDDDDNEDDDMDDHNSNDDVNDLDFDCGNHEVGDAGAMETTVKATAVEEMNIGYVSWTSAKPDWSSNLTQTQTNSKQSLYDFVSRSRVFKMANPMTLTPSEFTITNSCTPKEKAVECAIQHVQNNGDKKAFAIASSRWISGLHSSDTCPDNHVLDIFLVDEEGQIELWAIVDKMADDNATWKYLFISGRITKRKLLYGKSHTSGCHFMHNIWIKCHIYKLEMRELFRVDDDFSQWFKMRATAVDELKYRLAQTFLNKEACIRNIFGEEQSILLTEDQMEHIFSIGMKKFNFIEGPPGSGKTYLALYLCRKYTNYGYIYKTSTYKNFLLHQKLEEHRLFFIEDIVEYINERRFDIIDCLIFDDAQNITLPESTWLSLFQFLILSDKTKLVVLGDSRYQYFDTDVSEGHRSSAYLQELCSSYKFSATVQTLSSIHRNTRKVVSFIKASFEGNAAYPESSDISCTHPSDGDDIEVQYLSHILSDKRNNSLLEFTQSLIDPAHNLNNARIPYEPKAVAVLVDTINAAKDAEKLQKIFKTYVDQGVSVHDAATFPVTGYTIDTLDNFMGFDRWICIVVVSEAIQQSDHQFLGRTLSNPCYRTFLASRGISRVVFVVGSPFKSSTGSKFNMKESDLRLVGKSVGAKLICAMQQDRSIPDLCFLHLNDVRPTVCYTSVMDHDLHLVTMDEQSVDLSVDKPDVRKPWCIASSVDGSRLALAAGDDVLDGPWRWSVYAVEAKRLKKLTTFDLATRPRSLHWTSTGNVLIIMGKPASALSLSCCSPLDGQELWCVDETITQISRHSPCHMSLSSDTGRIYVTDISCVRELSSEGQHVRDIDTSFVSQPEAVCVDAAGQSIFFSGRLGQEIYQSHTDGGEPWEVIQAPGNVWEVHLHEDKTLGVATDRGFALYDISDLI